MNKALLDPMLASAGELAAEEPGYGTWLENKIALGLEQAGDRSKLIPADDVWRTLGLER